MSGLNTQQRAFLKNKTIEDRKTVGEWLTFFEPLAIGDLENKQKTEKMIRVTGVMTGGGVILAELIGVVGLQPQFEVVGAGMLVGVAVLALVMNRWRRYRRRLELHNNLSRFLVPFLTLLEKNDEPVFFKLDFTSRDFDGEALAAWKRTGVDYGDFRFDHAWLEGKLPMRDGAFVEIKATDHLMAKVTNRIEKDGESFSGNVPMITWRMEREITIKGSFPEPYHTPGPHVCHVDREDGCLVHERRRTLFYKCPDEVVCVAPVKELFDEVCESVLPMAA